MKNSILINTETKRIVAVGDKLQTFRGEPVVVTGWQPPRHIGSTGRIYVTPEGYPAEFQAFFPSVCGCEIVTGGAQ